MQIRKKKMMISLRTQFLEVKGRLNVPVFWPVVQITTGFPGGSVVKNLPARQEMWVWFLGQEDPLEEKMITHSSFLDWRIPWMRSLAGYSPWGHKRVEHDLVTKHIHTGYNRVRHQFIWSECSPPPHQTQIKYHCKRPNNHTSKSAGCQLFWKFHRNFLSWLRGIRRILILVQVCEW